MAIRAQLVDHGQYRAQLMLAGRVVAESQRTFGTPAYALKKALEARRAHSKRQATPGFAWFPAQ